MIDLFSYINFQEPTWDLFIVGFYILAVALYGFAMGKSRLVVNMMAIYVAMIVARGFAQVQIAHDLITKEYMFFAQSGIFIVGFIGLYYLFSRKSPLGRVAHTARKEKITHIVAYSIGHVGLILTAVLSFIPGGSDIQFSPITQTIFMSEIAQFVWILIPVFLMVLFPENIRRRSDDD